MTEQRRSLCGMCQKVAEKLNLWGKESQPGRREGLGAKRGTKRGEGARTSQPGSPGRSGSETSLRLDLPRSWEGRDVLGHQLLVLGRWGVGRGRGFIWGNLRTLRPLAASTAQLQTLSALSTSCLVLQGQISRGGKLASITCHLPAWWGWPLHWAPLLDKGRVVIKHRRENGFLCSCCRSTVIDVVVVQSLSPVWLFYDPMECSLPGSSVHVIL